MLDRERACKKESWPVSRERGLLVIQRKCEAPLALRWAWSPDRTNERARVHAGVCAARRAAPGHTVGEEASQRGNLRAQARMLYGGKTQAPRFQVAQASRRSHPVGSRLVVVFFTPRKFCGEIAMCEPPWISAESPV